MKAITIESFGKGENFKLQDVPVPEPKEGQVLVEVAGSNVNPFDTMVVGGMLGENSPKFPFTPGGDFAGVVKKTAPDVTKYKSGDEVYGTAIVLSGGSGSYAEFAVANVKNIALKPKSVTLIEAASLPLVGSSAVQAIIEEINLQADQKILIHGAAGGIGTAAVQIAKSIGAYVAVTVSTKDIDFIKNLGADEIIDFKTQKFDEILKDFDAVYDTIGQDVMVRSFKVLKKGGVLASMKGQPDGQLCEQYGVRGVAVMTKNSDDHLTRLAELVDRGVIKPQIDKIFPLISSAEAFKYKMEAHPRGKVVIQVKK